ncbi:hypothetical protein AOLI_G00046060 [Acnodon oligacanthus]
MANGLCERYRSKAGLDFGFGFLPAGSPEGGTVMASRVNVNVCGQIYITDICHQFMTSTFDKNSRNHCSRGRR